MTISPNTAPGTEIVCINDDPCLCRYYSGCGNLDGLKAGEIYTVRNFGIDPTCGEIFVRVFDITRIKWGGLEWGFDLRRFRYLDLAGLDELLKVKEPEKVE